MLFLRICAVFPLVVATFLLAGAATAEDAPVPAQSGAASSVIDKVRPSVVQIRGYFGSNTAKAFHGTGFAVADGGILVTNYHVVAELVQSPETYRLDYLAPDGRSGAITVLAVDARNDLAIVKADQLAARPLPLARVPLAKGARAYSVGYPLDVGLTITEGIANGIVEDNFIDRIHYSGAINGGMSGGPALNEAGEVIGVNVSGYRFEQLVSFLVPVDAVAKLVEQVPATAADLAVIAKTVDHQLHAHSADLLAALPGKLATENSTGYLLPAKLAPFIDCSANGNSSKSDPVQYVRIDCEAKSGLYLQSSLYSGDITYSHIVLKSETLGPWRFAKRLSDWSKDYGSYGSSKHVGPFSCNTEVVALKGFDANLTLCARSYRKLSGLYDITLRATSLNGNNSGFTSEMKLFGFEYAAGLAFARRYVELMEWTP